MITLYDTAQHQKVKFESLELGRVRMYVCGPTVYNYVHIGNARTFISFDAIRRYLEWRGFEVEFVSNITDVDDKIIAKANEEGRTAAEVAAEYSKAFIDDMHAINVKDPTIRPRATEEIDSMIELVSELVERGHAYEVDGDVYFSVRSFSQYGELSGRNIDEMESGHRDLRTEGIGDRKRDPLDFAVWKAAKPGEPAWDSPWGKGRPGWHIECSAMSRKYLGLPFDIHGGGADLVFPHHENERAQAMAATGSEFSHHWMHGGMLQINSEKMSKSLGNFKLLRDVLETTDPNVLRFLMLQTHYRSPLDFSADRLAEAQTAFGRIVNAVKNIDWQLTTPDAADSCLSAEDAAALVREARLNYVEAMDDDFNTPKALGCVFDFVSSVNAMLDGKQLSADDKEIAQALRSQIVELVTVFGIDFDAALAAGDESDDAYPVEFLALAAEVAGYEGADGEEAATALIEARAAARAQKNWAVADAIRDRLAEIGFTVKDTPQGCRLERA
jgi:cysteinyl-tRNA synthetase